MPTPLDTNHLRPYSLPFRTHSLKQQKQRPVGSVGVEALLDQARDGRLTVIVA
jgi:hypothetical protein